MSKKTVDYQDLNRQETEQDGPQAGRSRHLRALHQSQAFTALTRGLSKSPSNTQKTTASYLTGKPTTQK